MLYYIFTNVLYGLYDAPSTRLVVLSFVAFPVALQLDTIFVCLLRTSIHKACIGLIPIGHKEGGVAPAFTAGVDMTCICNIDIRI